MANRRGPKSQESLSPITALTILQNIVLREASDQAGTSNQRENIDFETPFEGTAQLPYWGHAEGPSADIPQLEISQRDFDGSAEEVLPEEITRAYLDLDDINANGTGLDATTSVSERRNDFDQMEAGPSNVVRKNVRKELSEFLVVHSSSQQRIENDTEEDFQNVSLNRSSSSVSCPSVKGKGKGKGKGKAFKKTTTSRMSLLPAASDDDFVVETERPPKKVKVQVDNHSNNSELLRLLKKTNMKEAKANEPKDKRKKVIKQQVVENAIPSLPLPAPQPRAEEPEDEILHVFSQDAAQSTIRDFCELVRHTKRKQTEHFQNVEDGVVELRRCQVERDRELATRERLLEELRLVEERIMHKNEAVLQVEERLRSHRDAYDQTCTKMAGIQALLNGLDAH